MQGVIDEIQPELLGYDADDQRLVDQALIDLDRTPDKSRLGANAIVGVSLAVARAAAESAGLPLFRYLGGPNAHVLPVPQMNILNGGAHADTNVDIQEFMVAAGRRRHVRRGAALGAETYHALKSVLKQHGLFDRRRRRGRLRARPRPQPGGARPDRRGDRPRRASSRARTSRSPSTPPRPSSTPTAGTGSRAATRTAAEMTGIYADWLDAYPIVSLEDPLAEDDWPGWSELTARLGGRVQIVGDDIFVTNPEQLRRGIAEHSANSLLVKVNQIGTVTETLNAVALAQRSQFSCVISHRSGETEDTTIADLAVATNCGQIKTGAPARSERVAKYNQLLRIEELLGDAASYAGRAAFPRSAANGR